MFTFMTGFDWVGNKKKKHVNWVWLLNRLQIEIANQVQMTMIHLK